MQQPLAGAPFERRVVFTPSGLSGLVPAGATILEAARALGADLDSVCSGKGICGRCQVVVGAGSYPKWDITVDESHLSEPGPLELDYQGKRPLREGRRLGCAVRVLGDVVVDVPADSQLHKQVVRKELALEDLVIDPLVTLHYVDVPAEVPGEAGLSALERIRRQLAASWDRPDVAASAAVLPDLHAALDGAGGAMTVALRDDRIVAAWPGFVDQVLGVAVDVGSTTIAGHLVDLATGAVLASDGRMNPQIRFGEDLMSRVSYAMLNPGGAQALTAAVHAELDALVGDLVDRAAVGRDRVVDVVLVGNPIMHHLALGLDPTPLGQAPFTLATSDPVEARAGDIGIGCHTASVYVGPCIAGHVGADTAAAILSEGPHRGDAVQLLVDVGTNAEIVLGNHDGLWAASSPTGPAFEGAQLSSGQRATTGAIERIRIDRTTLEPRYRVIGCDAWSDEPGFEAGTRRSGVTGICGSGIIEVVAELFLAGIVDAQGVIRPELADRTDRVVAEGRTAAYVVQRGSGEGRPELRITQNDVRAVQLAKAALRAGIELLLEHAGITTVDEVRLAGAFGTHIDPLHAMVLGLIPDCPLGAVKAVGNAAGAGAVRALLSAQQRREMEQVVRAVTKVETATEPRFQELFVAALALPHLTAPSPHLAELVELPVGSGTDTGPRRRRRRNTAPTDRSAAALARKEPS